MTDNSGHAQVPAAPVQPNPALAALAGLVGDWEMELSNGSFIPSGSTSIKGPAAFEWAQDGALLLMRMGDKPPAPPAALWLIGRDEASANYSVFYYDARRVSRLYQMSFAEGAWKIWRDAPGFSQRFEGQLSADGRTITAHWEKSSDGAAWEHDFDVMYRKVS